MSDVSMSNKMLGEKLSTLQQKIKEAKVPVILVFESNCENYKERILGKMILNLDPRGFEVYVKRKENESSKYYPFLQKYWHNIPNKGDFTIYDYNWYSEYSKKRKDSINIFERQLADDDDLIIKFYIHNLKKDDEINKKISSMIEDTDTEYAKWNVIQSETKDDALNRVLNILINNVEQRLGLKKVTHSGIIPSAMNFPLVKMPKLKDISLDCSLNEYEYNQKLEELQKKLRKLSDKLTAKNIPLVICYEGWDAAGKGGNIKRVAA